jgi:hypothetical protein
MSGKELVGDGPGDIFIDRKSMWGKGFRYVTCVVWPAVVFLILYSIYF